MARKEVEGLSVLSRCVGQIIQPAMLTLSNIFVSNTCVADY